MTLRLPGCFAMTETGHGSRRAVAAHHGDVRPRRQEFVDQHARTTRPQGLHRRRRPRRPARGGVRPAGQRRRGATACTRCWCRSATSAARRAAGVTIEDCGHKAGLNGVDNGRLWFDHVRVPREALLDRYAQRRAPTGTYSSPIENPRQRFFTMLGTLVGGRVSVAGAAGERDARSRWPSRCATPSAARQFAPPDGDGGRAARLPAAPAPAAAARWRTRTRCTSRRTSWSPDAARRADSRGRDADEHEQRELEARAAGIKALSHLARDPHHPGVPRGVRRRRLPRGEPAAAAQGRHRRVHHLRGRQHRAAAAGRQGAAHRLPRRSSAASTRGGWCASRPGRWPAPSWSAPPPAT